jgi:hypothetical protein
MSTSKVVYNGETLIDISEDTVTPETLAEGATAHNSNGEQITGTMKAGSGVSVQADLAQSDPNEPDYVKGQEVIDEKIEAYAVAKAEKGAVNGVATLDANGKIPMNQLPEGITTGGSTNNAEFKVTNKTGWLSKTIAYGAECKVILDWSSIEDGISTGNGTVKISVGDTVKSIYEVNQGEIPVDIDNYLLIGKNTIGVEISDLYGNNRKIVFTVSCVKVSIESYFDGNVAYTGVIPYSYTPTGAIEKTVHFLVDGEEIDTQTVTVSGREQSFNIPAQSHGNHTFEVYFTGEIDGQPVESNHLLYDLICYEEGNTAPIISCVFDTKSVKQFATVNLSYIVYTPQLLSSEVTITDNFGYSTTRTVDRTPQPFSYKAENVGATEITFKVGETERVISFDVAENKINVHAETSNLELYLSSKGRSNSDKETPPLEWSYGDVKAELTGFNLTNDCWQLDNNGDTVLRVTGDARVNIPFKIFENDFRSSGKTIEFEFATRDVLDYEAVILSCMSGGRGIEITAQKAILSFEGGEIFTQYKEDEHIRIAFTVEKRAENRLIKIFINGVMSGAVQYADGTDFSQASPVEISIGSNDCTTDIYCIRVYGNNLSQYQILDNWIADTQNLEELLKKYDKNNIFDDFGNVSVEKLELLNVPYFVVEAADYSILPDAEDEELIVNGKYIDPLHPERSFVFNNAIMTPQGTSSLNYERKNYKYKFENGFIVNGSQADKYQLRETSVPTSTFTFKTDFASSEGANNVELAMLYDEVNPERTPPQEEDSRVRQGIEGYPCVMFYYDGSQYNFIGKYNFNNDKGTPEVFGLNNGDESWEIRLNNTDMALWKDDDFSNGAWESTFEARYPKKNKDIANLQAFTSWLKTTDTEAVDTEEEKQARIEKFRNEFADWANVDAMLFNYVFTETFLMVDNRAKNAFPTRYDEDGKWIILPYDFDTAIGINNNGELKFGYELEDTDFVNGNTVFNGQDSVLYVNMRLAFPEEIKAMYQTARKNKAFSYEAVEKRFADHQSVWGEALFNEDSRFKYIEPLITKGVNDLPMLQGSKASQRQWWLYNRFRYLDSKYNTGDSASDFISFYAYVKEDLYLKPYADIYAAAKFDSEYVAVRALRNGTPEEGYKVENKTAKEPGEAAKDQVVTIYSASQLADVGDLSKFKIGRVDFSKGTKLSKLKVGDGGDYENPNLTNLTIGNLTLLTELDVRNCTNLAQTVNVSGCTNLEHAYFEGTRITGLTLPNGGILKTLHLPSTIENLTIRNQPLLTDFEMPSYENLTTLRLENLDVDLFDTLSMILQMPANSRVRVLGVEWTIDTAEEIFEAFDKLDSYRGLDEYGNNVDKPQISGVIHTGTITSEQLKEMQLRQPNFTIDYEHISSVVNFFNYDGTLLHTTTVWDNGNCPDPIPEIGTPLRPETEESKFIYRGWDKSLESITENTDITALYDEHKKYYISFIDNFGNAVKVNGNDTNIYYDIEGENIVALPAALPQYSIVDGQGATWDYHFEGWSLNGKDVIEIPAASGTDYHITYQAVFSEHRVYVVKFMNDGNIHSELHLYEGENVTVPETPARVSTYQFNYEFAGWTIDGNTVVDVAETIGTEDITYIAKYTAIDRYYTVTFLNWNGDVVKSYSVKHDETPTCDTPTRESTAQYFYDFDGWSPEVVAVTGEAVYTATYLATIRTYTVKWQNEDGSALENDVNVPYGTMPSYDGATPTKPATAQYSYTFAGWHIAISEVKGDITYKATYTAEVNKYTVTWKNHNGTVLETDTKVPYGDMPEYNGSTPTKTATAQYTFAFAGWDTAVSEVTGNVVYTAIFTQHIRSYTIKFVDYNGSVLKSETLEYGSMPTAPTPTRTGYDFTGWDKSIVAVTGEATYTAQYKIKTFTIKFVDYNGTVLSTQTVEYGKTPTAPNPSRTGYDFTGWDSTVVSATADKTYTAQYKIKTFTIKFVDYNGTVLSTQTVEYGKTPTAPTPTRDGYQFAGWDSSITVVTSDKTYTARYIATGSVTANPSAYGAINNSTYFRNPANAYGTSGEASTTQSAEGKEGVGHFYGMNFNELQNKKNVQITGIELFAWCRGYYDTVSTTAKIGVNIITNVNTNQVTGSSYDTYTDLGDGVKWWHNGPAKEIKGINLTLSSDNFPNALAWMNANLDKVISGVNSGTFGLRVTLLYAKVKNIGMTIHYTYDV